MSDPKRATLITVGATKSAKNNVNKTVRLTINLVESNESKYPELNYKELVIAEERKKKVENGKTAGLNPFSDNDEDVERVAKKFEQKYGGKSTYGRKGRSKRDDFADIGAGYDESDSFIDNTDGYDEMIPPECDTLYGGFYINCGSLEFKSVPENQAPPGDADRRNKRRISSSSSEEDSSETSSESESQDEKDPKPVANGVVDSHKTEHRKKKNKKIEKKKAKKIRRTDSSAATSGKQTSDDNAHGDAESVDTNTSQSDSLTSKPAPSSEAAVTSDSSRDTEAKIDVKLPPQVLQVLESLEAAAAKLLADNPGAKDLVAKMEEHTVRLTRALSMCGAEAAAVRVASGRAAAALRTTRHKILQRARPQTATATPTATANPQPTSTALTVTASGVTAVTSATTMTSATTVTSATAMTSSTSSKRKFDDDLGDFEPTQLTSEEREAKIVETLKRLKSLIDERKPAMIASYNAECERVQEERKKIQIASVEGGPHVEKRLPKRRFPWCPRSRALLSRLRRLAKDPAAAATLLASRALPLFPSGFVRMPTLLRQADLSKDIKVSDVKRQRLGSSSQPPSQPPQLPLPEPIQFPSSLTVTTTNVKLCTDKTETAEEKPYKSNSALGSIINSFSLSKDLIVEKPDKKESDKIKEDLYIPPNNIGSITITPVSSMAQKPDKKINNNVPEKQSGLIRVKSPAALNDMVKKDKSKIDVVQDENNKKDKPRVVTGNEINRNDAKKDKIRNIDVKELYRNVSEPKKDRVKPNEIQRDKVKKPEKEKAKNQEKRVPSPLHVDTSFQPNKKDPSPKQKDDPIPQKQIEHMRVTENNIPRPALVPVHHSPTFAKPDKRPPEVKKKKEIVIVSDVDPLSNDMTEPLAVDDSSSDVEVVEDNRTEPSEVKRSDKSEPVPSKDQVSVDSKKLNSAKCKSAKEWESKKNEAEEANDDINTLMRNLRDLQNKKGDGVESAKEDIGTLTANVNDLEHSQEPTKFNSTSYGGVIANAADKWPRSALQHSASLDPQTDDKLAERTSLNKTDGCSRVNGSS